MEIWRENLPKLLVPSQHDRMKIRLDVSGLRFMNFFVPDTSARGPKYRSSSER
jgi:hypothetical protein